MLVSKKEYNKEITIEKNIIKDICDFYTGKIVMAVKDIECSRAETDSEGNEEKIFLLKGSSVRIRSIEEGDKYLRFCCECCNDKGEIEAVTIDKPIVKEKLVFKKTFSTPISSENQKKIDKIPTAEQVMSDLFTTNLVLLRKSEEFNDRQEERDSKLRRGHYGYQIFEGLSIFGSLMGGYKVTTSISPELLSDSSTGIAELGIEYTEKTLDIMQNIDTIGFGVIISVVFLIGWLGILTLIQHLTDKFVSKKKNIWRRLYKWIHGEDYKETDRNEDLYNAMNEEELYNLEKVSITSITDRKPRLLSVGKIKKEKYKKDLELYRTVKDGSGKEVFEFPSFPTGMEGYNGKIADTKGE